MEFVSINKKNRGLKRNIKSIETWKNDNINLDIRQLKLNNYQICKIWVSPWRDLFKIGKNHIGFKPIPYKLRNIMIKYFIDIYKSWESEIKKLKIPYYLKFWFFDNRFNNSQIVIGINERIDWYKNTFSKPNEEKTFPIKKYPKNQIELSKFSWQYFFDEDMIDESDFISPDEQIYLEKIKKKSYRNFPYKTNAGVSKIYCIKEGDLWIGGY